MTEIRCLYFGALLDTTPPATNQHPNAVRYGPYIVRDQDVWADAVGGEPTLEEVEAMAAPPRRRIAKSVVLARITDQQLAAAIGVMTIRQQERWRAADQPTVYVDDPDLLAVLHYVGADPDVVLAPEE